MRRAILFLAVALAAGAHAQSQEAKQLAEFRAGYVKAKAALAAHPNDRKAKRAFVAAGDKFALATMTAESLPRKTKYVDSLRIYREVLKVDPQNGEAKNNSQMIVAIYKQMGRPIPK